MKKLLLLLVFFPFISFANEECANLSETYQVYACARAKRNDSEKELNNTYNKVITKINKSYESDPEIRDDYIETVTKSQQKWMDFRDINCAVYAFQIESGKPAHAESVNTCISDMSNKRNEELLMILDSI